MKSNISSKYVGKFSVWKRIIWLSFNLMCGSNLWMGSKRGLYPSMATTMSTALPFSRIMLDWEPPGRSWVVNTWEFLMFKRNPLGFWYFWPYEMVWYCTFVWLLVFCYYRDPQLIMRIGKATALDVRATRIPYAFAPCFAVTKQSYTISFYKFLTLPEQAFS